MKTNKENKGENERINNASGCECGLSRYTNRLKSGTNGGSHTTWG